MRCASEATDGDCWMHASRSLTVELPTHLGRQEVLVLLRPSCVKATFAWAAVGAGSLFLCVVPPTLSISPPPLPLQPFQVSSSPSPCIPYLACAPAHLASLHISETHVASIAFAVVVPALHLGASPRSRLSL